MLLSVFTLLLAATGCSSQRIVRTEHVVVGRVEVRSTPPAQVMVDGELVGWTPLRIPVRRIRHEVEVTDYVVSDDASTTVVVMGIITACCPVIAPIYFAGFASDGMFVKREVNCHKEWEETSMIVRLEREGFRPAQIEIASSSFPREWTPTLAAIPKEPTPEETATQVVRIAGDTAREAAYVRRRAREIVDEAVRTQQNLLNKRWEAPAGK